MFSVFLRVKNAEKEVRKFFKKAVLPAYKRISGAYTPCAHHLTLLPVPSAASPVAPGSGYLARYPRCPVLGFCFPHLALQYVRYLDQQFCLHQPFVHFRPVLFPIGSHFLLQVRRSHYWPGLFLILLEPLLLLIQPVRQVLNRFLASWCCRFHVISTLGANDVVLDCGEYR